MELYLRRTAFQGGNRIDCNDYYIRLQISLQRGTRFFYTSSNEPDIVCPECGGHLKYRDSRLRICKRYGCNSTHILIRRLKCSCGRMHNEMPDILVPHKHYANEVVENVLDEVSTPYDESTEDYPCEATMNRWKYWLMKNL